MAPLVPLPLSTVIFHLIQSIKLEISLHSMCSHLVKVVDTEKTDFFYDQVKLKPEDSETFLVVPLLRNERVLQQDSNNITEIPQTYQFSPRFCRPCSLVLHLITHSVVQQARTEANDDDVDDDDSETPEWPTVAIPGHPHNDFHVFLFQHSPDISGLLKFARMTRKIHNSFHVVFEGESLLNVYALSTAGDKLIHLSTNHAGDTDSLLRLGEEGAKRLNFEGSNLVVKVCARCGTGILEYFETGTFYDFIAGTIYEVSLSVNATAELEPVFSLPTDGLTDEGEWDEWALPLVEGSAAISTLMRHSAIVSKVVTFARPISHESCCFVTAKPKIARNPQLLSRLVKPLGSDVWIASAVAIVILCFTLEAIFRFAEPNLNSADEKLLFDLRLCGPKGTNKYSTFAPSVLGAVLKPVVDQSPISSKPLQEELRRRILSRLVLSCWLLALIVLGCGYRSKMTSLIVTPTYTKPPSTFQELADSHFKLFAVFWGGILQKDFATMDNEYSRKILQRVTEYNYFDPDCYLTIFKGDHACIGYNILFEELAVGLLVDQHGQYMFQRSKETLFPATINFGISKYYPGLVERVNYIIRTLESNGILSMWRNNQQRRFITLGRRTIADRIHIFSEINRKFDLDDNFPFLIVQLMLFGAAPAILLFCCELLSPCLRWYMWRLRLYIWLGKI